MSETFNCTSGCNYPKYEKIKKLSSALIVQYANDFKKNLPSRFKDHRMNEKSEFVFDKRLYYELFSIDTKKYPNGRPNSCNISYTYNCYSGMRPGKKEGDTLFFHYTLNKLTGNASWLFCHGNFGDPDFQIDPTHSRRLNKILINEVVEPDNCNKHVHSYYHHLIQTAHGVLIYFATLDSGEKDVDPKGLYSYDALYIHKPDNCKPIEAAILLGLGSNYQINGKEGSVDNQLMRMIPYNRDGLCYHIVKALEPEYSMPGKPDTANIKVKFRSNTSVEINIKPFSD